MVLKQRRRDTEESRRPGTEQKVSRLARRPRNSRAINIEFRGRNWPTCFELKVAEGTCPSSKPYTSPSCEDRKNLRACALYRSQWGGRAAHMGQRVHRLDNGADVSDAVKESETAMFGRPKKLKKEEIAVIRVRTKTHPLLPPKGSRRQYQRRSMVRRKSRPLIKRGRRSANKRKERYRGKGRTFHGSGTMMCSPCGAGKQFRRDVRRRREIAQQNQQEK